MKKNKYIAPVIVGLITFACMFAILMVVLLDPFDDAGWLKWPIVIMFLAFNVITVYVVLERINEIKGGEEDDLSKY